MRTKFPMTTYTKGELRDLVRTSPGMAVAVLAALYNFQTEDEQMMGGTVHQNGKGFNGADGPILSDFMAYYNTRGYLTDRQLEFVKRSVPKYLGQLEGVPLQPLPFKTFEAAQSKDGLFLNPKEVTIKGKLMVIKFPYDAALVSLVKTLSGRAWDSVDLCWTAPLSVDSYLSLKGWGFTFNVTDADTTQFIEDIAKRLEQTNGRGDTVDEPAGSDFPILDVIPGLKRELYPYQQVGVSFIESRKGRALVADEMGLGKTPQSIAYLQLHPEHRDRVGSAIIVCPATLKLNWEREIHAWGTFGKDVQVIEGLYSPDTKITGKVLIINYDILPNRYLFASGDFSWISTREFEKVMLKGKRGIWVEIRRSGWVDYLLDMNPKVVVTDESQYWKNDDAARTVAVKRMADGVESFIALSGTPLENRPEELFNVINAVNPDLFPHYFNYCKRYCGAVHNGYGWDFSGASNIAELHQKLSASIMIRRKKADVLKDLPPKVRSVIPMDITNRREYNRAEADFIEWLNEKFGAEKAESARQAEALVRIESMKQLAVKGKLDACIKWIADFLDSGKKLIVSTTHTNVLEAVLKAFPKISLRIDGSVPVGPKRQAMVDAFQNDPTKTLLVGNLVSIGVGLTLTAASDTCTIELGWKPGLHDQFEDRVHRIGQEADSVNAWYLIAEGTVEEEIAELIDQKRNVLSQVLDGEEADSKSLLVDLLKKYKK